MALLQSELQRVRYELGYNNLSVGAEPYISYIAVFDQVIATYLNAGATTTSSTAVIAPATPPAQVALTLASATGFAAGAAVSVDVDSRQETATVQSVSGSTITLLLANAHSGTYPVTVDGGEGIIRRILRRLDEIAGDAGALSSAVSSAGIKRVDDVEFFGVMGTGAASSRVAELRALRMYWRDELASALGVPNGWRAKQSANSCSALY